MQALEVEKADDPLVVGLLEKLSRLCGRTDIAFCWLTSHTGIRGNEKADKILPLIVAFNDFKPLINRFMQNVWQQSWSSPANQNNKFFTFKLGLGEWFPGLRTNRREEILLEEN